MTRYPGIAALITIVAGCALDEPAPQESSTSAAVTTPPEWALALVPANLAMTTSAMSNGLSVTPTHPTTGQYTLQLPGLTPLGNVLVTPVASNAHCTVVNWYSNGSAVVVNVQCFAPMTGSLVDSGFSMSYVNDGSRHPGADHIAAAYTWYPGTGSTASSSYSWTSIGGPGVTVFVSNPAPGQYHVIMSGMAAPPGLPPLGVAQATAYGSAPRYCNATGWRNGGNFPPDRTIDVVCFDAAGNPANSAFTLRLWTVASWGALEGMYASDISPGSPSFTPPPALQSYVGASTWATVVSFAINPGRWIIGSPGLSATRSVPLANSLRPDGSYCAIESATGALTIVTRCYTPAGGRALVPFSTAYLDGRVGP